MPAELVTPAGGDGRRIAGLSCAEVADLLPEVVDAPIGRRRADRRVGRHVEQCLRCQAELAGYRRLLRALRTLRTDVLEPPPGGVASVLATVAAVGERQAGRALVGGHRGLYAGGLALAGAAAGAGAVLVVTGRRRRAGR